MDRFTAVARRFIARAVEAGHHSFQLIKLDHAEAYRQLAADNSVVDRIVVVAAPGGGTKYYR